MTGKPRKKPHGDDRLAGPGKLAQPDTTEDDPIEQDRREAATRVFDPIRRVRRNSGKPGCVADVRRELEAEWWELCVGTWQEEELRSAIHEDSREFREHTGMVWEPRVNEYASLEQCIRVHCSWLERILLARLKRDGEPKLWTDEDDEDHKEP